MEILKETRFVERRQFFNGQRLFASDLQGVEAFNREMRWLHNQSLHQPGIGNGFAVAGKKGDREVSIGPGYAIDAQGREIVSTKTEGEPVPPVASEADGSPVVFDLVVSYPQDEYLEESESRQGICSGPGVIRLTEAPIFCWIRLDANGQPKDTALKQDILSGMRIILARAEVLNCQLNKDVSIAQRISARPAKQPYICCGSVKPDWKPWEFLSNARARDVSGIPIILPVGLQAAIDTSECGFLTTPCYTVRIVGQRFWRLELDTENNEKTEIPLIVDGLTQIVDDQPQLQPSRKQFLLTVLLIGQLLTPDKNSRMFAPNDGSEKDSAALLLEKLLDSLSKNWSVQWIGVEG